MNILLINTNPVVSRLLTLCTRDDTLLLHEVSGPEEVQNDSYDVIIVDESSYGQKIVELLGRFAKSKKVLISYEDEIKGFDSIIKKPFLPSEVIELIESVTLDQEREEVLDESLGRDETHDENEIESIFPITTEENYVIDTSDELIEDEMPQIFDNNVSALDENIEEVIEAPSVLDGNEIEKIKTLLDMDEEIEVVDDILSDEEREIHKIKVIKEQLISDGLEIIEEDKIVEELSVALDGTLLRSKENKNKSKKSELKKANNKRIKEAVEITMKNMTKKQRKRLLKGEEIEVNVKLMDNNS